MIERDRFLDAARRLAATERNRFADPEDVATELGIGLYEATELVRRSEKERQAAKDYVPRQHRLAASSPVHRRRGLQQDDEAAS